MKYNIEKTDLDELLWRVEMNFTVEEQECLAGEVCSSLGIDLDNDYSAMDYLSEYLTTNEWKEWLVDTFLTGLRRDVVRCGGLEYDCIARYDCERGDFIEASRNGGLVCEIGGCLDDYTEEEIAEQILENMG